MNHFDFNSNCPCTTLPVLQPWTPCLPIRGGKLKTSKYYSTSNPQLPYACSGLAAGCTGSSSCNHHYHHQPQNVHANHQPNNTCSSSSLNSSYIWREASPSNFNVYSASVSSLNTAYRYSALNGCGGGGGGSGCGPNTGSPPEWQPLQQSSPNRSFMAQLKNKTISNYENVCMTPLLPIRKHKQTQHIKVWNKSAAAAAAAAASTSAPLMPPRGRSNSPIPQTSPSCMLSGGGGTGGRLLYDRRTNRSFEAPGEVSDRHQHYKIGPLRRSTPHLASGDGGFDGANVGGLTTSAASTSPSNRHSATWCCGNFVLKQWRKMNNYD